MERSIDECLDMENTPDDALIFWDNAVAFYTGSQVHNESGVFLFHLADSRCLSASTCGEDGSGTDGTAWVNFQVLQNFESGQKHLLERNCAATRANKEEIVRLMTIPLIQGALRRARMLEDEEDDYERHAGEAAAYSASVLPLVYACNPDDADIIHSNLKVSSSSSGVDFDEVRDAIARNLPCLRITCDEIGDVLELDSKSKTCARAKENASVNTELVEDSSSNTGTVILYSFLSIAVVVICYLAFKVSSQRSAEKEITFSVSQPSVSQSDKNLKGTDYVPQYWQDFQKKQDEPNLNLKDDEVVTGEML